jgi:hypothetical protein
MLIALVKKMNINFLGLTQLGPGLVVLDLAGGQISVAITTMARKPSQSQPRTSSAGPIRCKCNNFQPITTKDLICWAYQVQDQ